MTVRTRDRMLAPLSLVLVALTLGAPGARAGAARAAQPAETPATLREIGDDFEGVRLLAGSQRSAALAQAQQSLDQVLRGGMDGDQRAAARCLSGAIAFELGDFAVARDRYREAADGLAKGPFGDDAEFAAIQALEASGDDLAAARE